MKKFKLGLMVVGFLLICGLIYEGCREIKEVLNPNPPSNKDRLKEDEKEKIIIDSSGDVRRIRRGRDGATQNERISTGAERVELVIKDDGTVEYREKTFGFIFEPGLNTSMDKDSVMIGPDVRFAYWRNFGLITGVSTTIHDPTIEGKSFQKFRVHIGVGYRLPFQKFRNTSLVFSYNSNASYQVGVRVKF